jgi:choline dehydrogenase
VLSLPGLVRPLSRGWVKLAGTDPTAYPRVNPNYFGERADLDRMTMMVHMARDIYATKAFTEGWQISELAPGPKATSDAELADWVTENVGSYYHFAGSCKMGIDRMAVVDPQLRVRGVDGLRVADASVMPAVTSTNPHTTVVMIGERAADFIKADVAGAAR